MSLHIDNPREGDESNEDRRERNERRHEAVPGCPPESESLGAMIELCARVRVFRLNQQAFNASELLAAVLRADERLWDAQRKGNV